MRDNAQHPIVKGMFILLAVTFVVWGIGDIFRGSGGAGNVATVGDHAVTSSELDNMVRREISGYEAIMGKAISEEEANAMGIRRYSLRKLIQDKLTSIRAEDLKLTAGNKAIAGRIQENSVFFNEEGKFDKDRFRAILNANGFTEEKYVNFIKQEYSVNNLLDSMTLVAIIPEIMAEELFKIRTEVRKADILTIPSDFIKNVPEPSEADLIQFYQDNQNYFSVPEQRSLTYITFDSEKIKGEIKPSREELEALYEVNVNQYKVEESRDVEQYLFKTEKEAQTAYEKISKNIIKPFKKNKVELGSVTESNAPEEIRDIIFSLGVNGISKPVETQFGWHVLIVKSIEPEKIKSFNEVRKEIEQEAIELQLSEAFARFGNDIEDEFASGKTIEEVAGEFDIEVKKVPVIDNKGKGKDGKNIVGLPDVDMLLPMIFDMDTGVPSSLTLLSDNESYIVLRVDNITLSRVKALDEVKGTAIGMRKKQDQEEELRKESAQIAKKLHSGEDIKALAKKLGLTLKVGHEVERPLQSSAQTDVSGVPAMLAKELFSLKNTGETTASYRQRDGSFSIARLVSVEKLSPDDDKEDYNSIKSQLEDAMRNDIMEQYINYLRKEYPVSIKTNAFSGADGQGE